ncbi:unnamed protein product [Schistocephalus solidus]|uniref:Uncharacterized protein n=1 Tax=Schistocephalus solidus TaxID=70667 RepID=A0A183TF73_SCHSO|nr:unnamed protein product [Schistocephalus solidus]
MASEQCHVSSSWDEDDNVRDAPLTTGHAAILRDLLPPFIATPPRQRTIPPHFRNLSWPGLRPTTKIRTNRFAWPCI